LLTLDKREPDVLVTVSGPEEDLCAVHRASMYGVETALTYFMNKKHVQLHGYIHVLYVWMQLSRGVSSTYKEGDKWERGKGIKNSQNHITIINNIYILTVSITGSCNSMYRIKRSHLAKLLP
jgi:hypothetical protein